jgi:hypothetical protein
VRSAVLVSIGVVLLLAAFALLVVRMWPRVARG